MLLNPERVDGSFWETLLYGRWVYEMVPEMFLNPEKGLAKNLGNVTTSETGFWKGLGNVDMPRKGLWRSLGEVQIPKESLGDAYNCFETISQTYS